MGVVASARAPVASRGAVAAVPVRTQSRSVGFVGSEQGRRGLALSAARARTARGARGFEVVAQAISEVRAGPRPSPRATSRDASAHVFRTRRGGISAKTPKPCSAERGRMPLRTTRSAGRRESARVATERRRPRATIRTPSAPSAPSSALVASRARAHPRASRSDGTKSSPRATRRHGATYPHLPTLPLLETSDADRDDPHLSPISNSPRPPRLPPRRRAARTRRSATSAACT